MNMNIKIGSNILHELDSYIEKLRTNYIYIITDEYVNKLYKNTIIRIIKNYNSNIYVLPQGETSKSFDNVLSIYDNLLENNVDRNALIISIGGGVVGDISGFIASTYKRGLKYIQIPTTLLSQVDSSIGGKVGINYGGYKNIIGTFYFPEVTIIDTCFLDTLNYRQITCGLGEILKYGLIYDYDLFQFISMNLDNIYNKDHDILLTIIKKSVSIKENIVEDDIFDRGARQILNFGHTIGHSIEGYYEFSRYNHGEAVILGMMYEAFIAKDMGLIDESYFQSIYSVLRNIVEPIKFNSSEIEKLYELMKNDKKNEKGSIVFILPVGRGKVKPIKCIDKETVFNSLKGDWT